MKLILVTAMLLASSVGAVQPKDSPIMGTWQITVGGTKCVETYTFNGNGVRVYESADEKGESKFAISPAPSAAGYYKFTDVVSKTNGKLDCMSHTSPLGDSISAFVHFERQANAFFFCEAECQDRCVGPFTRVRQHSSP